MAATSEQTPKADHLLQTARNLIMRTYGTEISGPIIESARGATITDVEGKEILDFSSGQMCATLGHNHPKIVATIKQCADRVIHVNSVMLSPEVIKLAQLLVSLCPNPLEKVFFASTGSESTEAAVKLAKKVSGKYEVVGLSDSYHGATLGSAANTYIPEKRAGYGPPVPGGFMIPAPNCYRCPLRQTFPACDYACARIGFELVDKQSAGSLAALIAEPILGVGGQIDPPPGYLAVLRELCRARGMFFILDEAQTGLGRLGDVWGFTRDGAIPDILAISKTLGAGMPLSAVITNPDIEEAAYRKGYWFYTSHLNDPLACAVGLAALEIIQNEDLVKGAAVRGEYLKRALLSLQEKHEIIGDVRGRGLLLGVDLVEDRQSKKPAKAKGAKITQLCMEKGLFLQPVHQPERYLVWRIAPPLTISYAEIDRAITIMDEAIGAVCNVH